MKLAACALSSLVRIRGRKGHIVHGRGQRWIVRVRAESAGFFCHPLGAITVVALRAVRTVITAPGPCLEAIDRMGTKIAHSGLADDQGVPVEPFPGEQISQKAFIAALHMTVTSTGRRGPRTCIRFTGRFRYPPNRHDLGKQNVHLPSRKSSRSLRRA